MKDLEKMEKILIFFHNAGKKRILNQIKSIKLNQLNQRPKYFYQQNLTDPWNWHKFSMYQKNKTNQKDMLKWAHQHLLIEETKTPSWPDTGQYTTAMIMVCTWAFFKRISCIWKSRVHRRMGMFYLRNFCRNTFWFLCCHVWLRKTFTSLLNHSVFLSFLFFVWLFFRVLLLFYLFILINLNSLPLEKKIKTYSSE